MKPSRLAAPPNPAVFRAESAEDGGGFPGNSPPGGRGPSSAVRPRAGRGRGRPSGSPGVQLIREEHLTSSRNDTRSRSAFAYPVRTRAYRPLARARSAVSLALAAAPAPAAPRPSTGQSFRELEPRRQPHP
ncbi:unnamed protein product, partial [Nesidiocoris tenuis]